MPEPLKIYLDQMLRLDVSQALRGEGHIDTRLFFVGMHCQPSLLKFGCDGTGDYPITDNLAQNGLYLPSASNLKEDEIKYVCDEIRGREIKKVRRLED